MISLSYSRISLADIAQKLQLDSPEDAEFIVAKVTYTLAHRGVCVCVCVCVCGGVWVWVCV